MDYIEYTTEVTKKFLETISDKYASCLKEKSVRKVLKKLKYTIKLAETKVRELEDNIQEDNNPEAALNEPSKRKASRTHCHIPEYLQTHVQTQEDLSQVLPVKKSHSHSLILAIPKVQQ